MLQVWKLMIRGGVDGAAPAPAEEPVEDAVAADDASILDMKEKLTETYGEVTAEGDDE